MNRNKDDLQVRLNELSKLKDGWYNGQGVALSDAGMNFISSVFWNYPENLVIPLLFPDPDNGLTIEWEAAIKGAPSICVPFDEKLCRFHMFGEPADLEFEFDWRSSENWRVCWERLAGLGCFNGRLEKYHNPNGRSRLCWEDAALRLAFDIARYRVQDPFAQIGAVIIKKDNSIILGYNGAPPNVGIDWSDRNERRNKVIHAEENALDNIKFGEAKIMAVTAMPCESCIRKVAQKGVGTVYYAKELDGYDNEAAKKLARNFKIQLIQKKL